MSDFRFIDEAVATVTNPLVAPLMSFANDYWWPLWCVLFFLGFLLTLAPWQLPTEHNSFQAVAHVVRRSILYVGFIAIALFPFVYFVFDITFNKSIHDSDQFFINWFLKSFNQFKYYIVGSAIAGTFLRFYYFRFFHPWISSTLRDLRNKQSNESESDIRTERLRYNPKSFNPEDYYDNTNNKIFLGIDSNNKAIYVPASTWLETNMMITGPTRYGKGVVIGCLMDQAIRRGDQLIYIDPKNDKFAAKIMLQTCAQFDRPFYYVSLNDETVGYWSPFEGGKRRDAYNRLISIFGMMENSGDADFYKAMEKKVFNRLIKLDDPFDIESIYKKVKFHNETVQDDADRLLKIEAQLENWRQVESLNPPKNFKGFSLEKAMLENAVVYFQGSLNDEVVKTATKSFILEVIQESARLDKQRKTHLTLIIDEVRFLVSKTLADALATIVGFRVNIVTACQSINDLKTPDDINLDGEATYRSISTNSQLKLVYGGADSDTAEWVAKLSGSIVKQVTSMERVAVKAAGAEAWELGRTIKPLEEALIPENVALTLPPRVCAVFRPSELATVTFTSPVTVKDMAALEIWLSKQADHERESIQYAQQQLQKKLQEEVENIKFQTTEVGEQLHAVSHNTLNETPKIDTPSPVLDSTPSQVVTLPNNVRTYDMYELSQKDELSDDELRYLFTVKKRQIRFEALLSDEPERFNALHEKFKLLKIVKNQTNETPAFSSSEPIYSLDELIKKDALSEKEARWISRVPARLHELNRKNPVLYATLDEQYKRFVQPFDINELIKKRKFSTQERNWIFKQDNIRAVFAQSVDAELFEKELAIFSRRS